MHDDLMAQTIEESSALTLAFNQELHAQGIDRSDISSTQLIKIHVQFDAWALAQRKKARLEVCFDLYTKSYDVVVIAQN